MLKHLYTFCKIKNLYGQNKLLSKEKILLFKETCVPPGAEIFGDQKQFN